MFWIIYALIGIAIAIIAIDGRNGRRLITSIPLTVICITTWPFWLAMWLFLASKHGVVFERKGKTLWKSKN